MSEERPSTAATLLIVEDDDIRDTLADILEARGHVVIAARHGRDAIDRITSLRTRSSLILLDLSMPVDGEEFLAGQSSESLIVGSGDTRTREGPQA